MKIITGAVKVELAGGMSKGGEHETHYGATARFSDISYGSAIVTIDAQEMVSEDLREMATVFIALADALDRAA